MRSCFHRFQYVISAQSKQYFKIGMKSDRFRVLDYEFACRSCMTSDSFGKNFIITGEVESFFEDGTLKPEYALSEAIINFLPKSDLLCNYCGSNNIEISKIEFDGKSPKIEPSAKEFQLSIFTTQDGEIRIKNSGNIYLPHDFVGEAFNLIESVIRCISFEKFEKQDKGHIHMSVSTRYIGDALERINRFEKLSFAGFSKDDVLMYINTAKNHFIKSS